MIEDHKLNKALRAIQSLIIESRSLAFNKKSHRAIAKLLDDLEFLPALILENKDRSQQFDKYLESICYENNFHYIWTEYSADS